MQGSDTLCTHRLLPSGESSITPSQLPQGQGATTSNAFASKKVHNTSFDFCLYVSLFTLILYLYSQVITTNLANFKLDPPFSTFGNVSAIHESGQYIVYASKGMFFNLVCSCTVYGERSTISSSVHLDLIALNFSTFP